VRSNLDFSYNIPLSNPRTEKLSFQAGYQEEHVEDTDSESYKIGVRHIRNSDQGWLRTLFLEALQERYTAGAERGESTLLMPGVSWDRRSGDDPVSPRRGWRLSLELRGASKALLSDLDFFRVHGSAKGILPLGKGRVLGRTELGYSLVGGFSDLPPSQRFFAGGDNSVRGYGYHQLGPEDASGKVVGGRHVVTASIEYEHPVVDKWSAALFVDTGDAFNGSRIRLHNAVGVGARWRSPVGPIRVDLAHPLDKGEDVIRIHFSLGPDL
jgi:translocation and assembly module TamA